MLQQHGGELPAADADGGDVAVEGEGLVQLQQGDVVVVLVDRGVVRGVWENFHHLTPLLGVVVLLRVVFTCREKWAWAGPPSSVRMLQRTCAGPGQADVVTVLL